MRIALVGPVHPYRGGIAHYTAMLCKALRDRGNDVRMVSFKRQYPQALFPGRGDKDPSRSPLAVEDARYWIDSLNPLTWVTAFWRIRKLYPDLIVLQWWTPFWTPVWCVIGALNQLLDQTPLAFICHNVLPHERQWYDSLLTKMALQWGISFIVQSEDEKKLLLSMLPDASVMSVPLPVFDMFANQRVPKAEARRQLDLSQNVPTLLFFGIVREYKGLKDLLSAMPRVKKALGEVRLIVAGEFWDQKGPYLEMIDHLDLASSVIVEDRYIPNEEVPTYFSGADLVVAPYRRVTGSAAAQMARGFEVPVITTWKEEQPTDDVEDVTGLSVPPGDIEALADAIVAFFEGNRGSEEETREEAGRRRGSSWNELARLLEETAS